MIPAIAVAVMLCAVAGCCIYISYRIGQSISPTSHVIQRRLSRVEARVVKSEERIQQALEQHRQASGEQTAQGLRESAETLAQLVASLRRPIDDLHERLNGVRLELSRESVDLREDVEQALTTIRDGTRELLGELARANAERTEGIADQLRDLGADDERRHEGTRALLERTIAEVSVAHASGVSDARGALAAHGAEVLAIAANIERRIGEHGTELGRSAEEVKAALHSSEQRLDSLGLTVESSLNASRAHARQELEKLHATSSQHEVMWRETKMDFDALSRSLAQINRAFEVVRDQLAVPLRDADTHADVSAVLESSLQPDEFERDVELEPGSGRRVAFAVRLSDNPLGTVWLPIAVLSHVDGYRELVGASISGDTERLRDSIHKFDGSVLAAAKDLRDRFMAPPHTMNLAVLFVPTDDLYGEITRRGTLGEMLRRTYHVIVAGPETLPALVGGLREAFRGTAPSTGRPSNGGVARRM
jgi:DNA recombination protein RmuC